MNWRRWFKLSRFFVTRFRGITPARPCGSAVFGPARIVGMWWCEGDVGRSGKGSVVGPMRSCGSLVFGPARLVGVWRCEGKVGLRAGWSCHEPGRAR